MSSIELFTTLPTSTVSPWEIRGLMFGDGLFETMLVWGGGLPYAPWHRQRLAEGCARLGLDPDLAVVWGRLQGLDLPERGILKLVVGRGGGGRGFLPEADSMRRDWAIALLSAWTPPAAQPGVVGPSTTPALPPNHPLAGIKSLSAAHWVQVRREAQGQGWLDAIVPDAQGFLTEGAGHNIVWMTGADQIVTPPLNQGILPGIGRRRLLERLQQRGIRVEERPLHRDELPSGAKMILTNAVVPPRPAFWLAPPVQEDNLPDWLIAEIQAWPAP